MTARDVPEIRAQMTTWTRDPSQDGADAWFRFFVGPSPESATESRVFDRVDDVGAIITTTLAAQLPAAELFYVSADMTDLARHAADTLADYRLHPEDLPAPVGIMVYEHPPVAGTTTARHNPVSMVSWGPGRGGLWVHTWATTAPEQEVVVHIGRMLAELPRDMLLARATQLVADPYKPWEEENENLSENDIVDRVVAKTLVSFLPNLERAPIPLSFAPPHGFEWCALIPMQFTEMEGWPGVIATTPVHDPWITLQRTILATWLMMGQTLVRSEPETAPRAARRRIERLDPALDPTVRYIDLRRARTAPTDHTSDDPGRSTREYRHQWIVRGHWRNQYYPSRNDHRPIWIDPHLAGPEDKPLLGGERVNILRR